MVDFPGQDPGLIILRIFKPYDFPSFLKEKCTVFHGYQSKKKKKKLDSLS